MTSPHQLAAADLRGMSADQIVEAQNNGQLAAMLGQPVPESTDGQISADRIRDLSPEQIVAAHQAGQFDHALRGIDPTDTTDLTPTNDEEN